MEPPQDREATPTPSPDAAASPRPASARPDATASTRSRRRYAPRRPLPLEGRKKFAIAALAVTAVLAIACAWTVLELRQFLSGIPSEGYDPADEATVARAEAVDGRVDSFAALALVARVLCAIAFLLWFYRAHENLRLGGLQGLERSSGWAVGGFFVPLVGLILPCLAMIDVWKGSHALAGAGTLADWKRRRTPLMVLLWWFAFIGASILAVVANFKTGSDSRWDRDPAPVPDLISAATLMLESRIVEIVAALAASVLVLRISTLQARSPEGHLAAVFE